MYSEYLAQNVVQVKESQVNENNTSYVNIVNSFLSKGYNRKETDVIKLILENLDILGTFEPLNIDNFLPTVCHQRCRFLVRRVYLDITLCCSVKNMEAP